MAHLTISLGASLVVPFSIPRGWNGHRRKRAWRVRLRWQALCEAQMVAREREAEGKQVRYPSAHSSGKSLQQSALGAVRDILS